MLPFVLLGIWLSGTARADAPITGVIQIAAGRNHTCVLDAAGIKCWGDNTYGQTNLPV
ncbi:RCC1-like domain-containing protein, partial [Streptomyces scabiei]|uniref:RCC1-like domain-containing protein n=1 Tax=Streptomyces scabiei TaxID=1930 RepID=UPI0038F5E96E